MGKISALANAQLSAPFSIIDFFIEISGEESLSGAGELLAIYQP